jgi:hypothetical protein
VDAAVLIIERREPPLLAPAEYDAYTAFLPQNTAGRVAVTTWVERFCDRPAAR